MITIRWAAPAEREALEALQLRASLANPGDREALLANPDAVHLPLGHIERSEVIVAECDGKLAGFAVVLPRADGDAELDGLFVEPQCWRKGIGRALVRHCIDSPKLLGSRALHVLANPHAAGFYESCGFRRTGTAGTRFGVGFTMVLAIHARH